jgi:cytochrome c5
MANGSGHSQPLPPRRDEREECHSAPGEGARRRPGDREHVDERPQSGETALSAHAFSGRAIVFGRR